MSVTTLDIWEQFREPLEAFIRKQVSNTEDSRDILQDVFIKIHSRIDSLKNENRLAPWIYRITRNMIVDHYRRRRPTEELPDSILAETQEVEETAEAHIASGLRSMIEGLPDIYRDALLLTEIEGMKQHEMAEKLGLSVSGAKSRVQRGRMILRQALLDCCHFDFDRRGRMIDYAPRPTCCDRCRDDCAPSCGPGC